jgi:hypothetical protein
LPFPNSQEFLKEKNNLAVIRNRVRAFARLMGNFPQPRLVMPSISASFLPMLSARTLR